jgi:hypothetical protein
VTLYDHIELFQTIWIFVIGLPKFVAHTRFNGNHFLSLSYDEFDLSEFLLVFTLVFLKRLFFLSFRPITYECYIHKELEYDVCLFCKLP